MRLPGDRPIFGGHQATPQEHRVLNAAVKKMELVEMPEEVKADRLIGKRELLQLVPLSYSTIWDLMRRGEFPLSVRIGSRVFWNLNEIQSHLAALPRSEYRAPSSPEQGQTGGGR